MLPEPFAQWSLRWTVGIVWPKQPLPLMEPQFDDDGNPIADLRPRAPGTSNVITFAHDYWGRGAFIPIDLLQMIDLT